MQYKDVILAARPSHMLVASGTNWGPKHGLKDTRLCCAAFTGEHPDASRRSLHER